MSDIFNIEMLPAAFGDCLWVEYGDERYPSRVLIDGGIGGTRDVILRRIGDKPVKIELLVISHIDRDHIDGIVSLLRQPPKNLSIGEVWFNGWDHLPKKRLGGKSGEILTGLIRALKVKWNKTHFLGKAVVVPDEGKLPEVNLPGGMKLTLLSPGMAQLTKLAPVWEMECAKAGLIPGQGAPEEIEKIKPTRLGAEIDVEKLAGPPYEDDNTPPNGSSIAFAAEFGGRSVLFGADAHPQVLAAALRRWKHKPTIRFDVCKMPHHGSKANNTPPLLDMLDCTRYLYSTNGSQFSHPDREAIARVLVKKTSQKKEIIFNYASDQTKPWKDRALMEEWRYEPKYPTGKEGWEKVKV